MKIFLLLVGAMDSSTGILLMLAPEITLQLMGIQAPLETIFLRWVGAFVFSVGLLYFLPFLKKQTDGGHSGIRACLSTTTLVRANIAVFVIVAISSSALATAWISVALTDGILALVQIKILRSLDHE